MSLNEILTAKLDFNNYLFSLSFPEIVEYIESNPTKKDQVDWVLFTLPSVRFGKHIDDFPELILKHPDWPWNFDLYEVKANLQQKIDRLNQYIMTPLDFKSKPHAQNWLDKLIDRMESLKDVQQKKLVEESEKIKEDLDRQFKLKAEEKVLKPLFMAQSDLSESLDEDSDIEDLDLDEDGDPVFGMDPRSDNEYDYM